ncbi:MAG: GntR family transcriptional regulator [Clostridia bacterium]|nr:GntR family transcriptional regulator [Clostridia bacterium]
MITLDYQSRTPIYEQIVNEIERYISLGILKAEEQLPSIREFAMTLGINPNTVKKAYEELERRGSITVISTKGTFVSKNIGGVSQRKIKETIEKIRDEIRELEKLGISKEEIIKKL